MSALGPGLASSLGPRLGPGPGAPRDAYWLSGLQLEDLGSDGQVQLLRARCPASLDTWLVNRMLPDAPHAEAGLRRAFALRDALAPDWAVQPLHLVPTLDGPVLILRDQGGGPCLPRPGGERDLGGFLRLAAGAARALRCAHEGGLLHRAVMPASLVLGADGVVRLAGFGSAFREGLAAGDDPVPGTLLPYLPPERMRREGGAGDARSDLYALGMTLYEWLTGRLPFEAADALGWSHAHAARRAPPPSQFRPGTPGMVDTILLRLVAKEPASRYRSALLLERDLLRALAAWEQDGRIAEFEPGLEAEHGQISATQRLAGREAERRALRLALERVSTTGRPEVILLAGPAGSGKSALFQAMRQDMASLAAHAAEGKFDQRRRPIPHAALAQALRSLVLRILGQDDASRARWAAALGAALGRQSGAILTLVPEAELLTGAAPELPAGLSASLFRDVLRRLLATLAPPGQPLVLFLDDLQWMDEATPEFLAPFAGGDYPNILLVAAFRTGDDGAVPLRLQEALRAPAIPVQRFDLPPLDAAQARQIVADLLGGDPAGLAALSDAVWRRANGNPLFIRQLLQGMHEEGALRYDPAAARWNWDPDRIGGGERSAGLVELVLRRLARLPARSRAALRTMAVYGTRIGIARLAALLGVTELRVRQLLAPAAEARVIALEPEAAAFAHDRMHEAAYALLPPGRRAMAHARVARVLIATDPGGRNPDGTVLAAGHIEQAGASGILATDREAFARALIAAAAAAQDTGALAPALGKLALAETLLGLASGPGAAALAMARTRLEAECLILAGRFPDAAGVIARLLREAEADADRIAALQLEIRLQNLRSDFVGAIRTGLAALALLGIEVPRDAGQAEVTAAYARLRDSIGPRGPAALPDLPPMTDPRLRTAMDVLASVIGPANFLDDRLMFILLSEMVRLTVEHGIAPASSQGVGFFGVALAHQFSEYGRGFEFAQTGVRIAEAAGPGSLRTGALVALDQVGVWTRPFDFALACARAALEESRADGDLAMACYACNHIVSDLLAMGTPLGQVAEEIERSIAFTRKAHFRDVEAILEVQRDFVRSLRDEGSPMAGTAPESAMTPLVFWHWLFRGMAAWHAGKPEEAEESLARAAALSWSTPAHIHLVDFHLYSGLLRAERGDAGGLGPHLEAMRGWAGLNPDNFRDKTLLLEAEAAWLKGETLRAFRLFEEAIGAAAAADRPQIRALAHERAAACYRAENLEGAMRHHLRAAQGQYEAWGATAKAARLAGRKGARAARPPGRPDMARAHDELDLAAAMAAVQSLSGEIDTERLVERLVTLAMTSAGASRAALLLLDSGRPMVEALGTTDEGGIAVRFARAAPAPADMPLSVLYTVMQRRQPVSIPDLSEPHEHGFDGYFAKGGPRSLLCLPLVKQGALVGTLLLENDVSAHAFDGSRLALLDILASQAAISLENARLYAALRTSEASLALGQRISRSGSFRWNRATAEQRWSDELYAIWRADRREGPLPVAEMLRRVHPEDRAIFVAITRRRWQEAPSGPQGFRILGPDGEVRHVELLMEAAEPEVFVGVLTDVTERRGTEAALRNVRAELARTAQVTAMGELAASIAHEINQPLATILVQAGAATRWLSRASPDIGEALAGLRDIASDAQRASDIIRALRALAKQAPPERQDVTIDALVRKVAGLVSAEVEARGATIELETDAADFTVAADPVQMQQVILNLITNAVDAMEGITGRARRIIIRASLDAAGNMAEVLVTDTGPGIDPAHQARLFDPFFTTKASGLGMGLSICRSIVEAHGGRLECLSTGPEGTAFRLRLPIEARR